MYTLYDFPGDDLYHEYFWEDLLDLFDVSSFAPRGRLLPRFDDFPPSSDESPLAI